jgi:hypothetical protein
MSRYSLHKTVLLSEEFVEDLLNMTRSFKKLEDKVGRLYDVCYGFDHVAYYFVQLEPSDHCFDEIVVESDEKDEWPEVIDIDNIFDGLTGSDLGYFLRKCGAPHDHVENCFLDLPF